jgi:hypothetical protein
MFDRVEIARPPHADVRAEEGRTRRLDAERRGPDDRGVCVVRPDRRERSSDVESRGTDDGEVCFVCLDASHVDGSPLLVRVCACTSLGVHQACLQAFLNSEVRRSLRPSERRRCPICSQSYTAPIVSTSGPKPDWQPYKWWVVLKPGLAFGLGLVMVGLGTALMVTMDNKFVVFGLGLVFFGMCAFTIAAAEAARSRDRLEAAEANWVTVAQPAPPDQDAASTDEAAAARQPPHAVDAGLELLRSEAPTTRAGASACSAPLTSRSIDGQQ